MEWNMDAMAFRCWIELQQQLKVSPCVLLSEMNDREMPVACEVDIGNAVAMYALQCASGKPCACLDWNNNYGDDENKCILFHCGSAAQSLMTANPIGCFPERLPFRNIVANLMVRFRTTNKLQKTI